MKPTQMDINYAMDIVNTLFQNNFYSVLSYKTKYSIDDWQVEHEDLKLNLHIHLYQGETKVCIVLNDVDWVIKLSFLRSTDDFYVKNNLVIDFCELEAQYYHAAVIENIANSFAATYEIGEVYGIKVFLQEYAEIDESTFLEKFENYVREEYYYDMEKECVTEEDEEELASSVSDYVYSNMDDCDRIYAVLGYDDYSCKVLNFIDNHEINDLHEGNWGITKDGRIVMIDYSGYIG